MSGEIVLAIVTAVCTCVITCVTIWARTRNGELVNDVKDLRGKIEIMHDTIVSQNATISRQDAQWQGKGGDTHKFTQGEINKAAGIKP
jgi:membrane protein implicated in regulation of membrane protease activity